MDWCTRSAQIGIAALDEFGEWTIVDTDGLPEGAGAEGGLIPGRSIRQVVTGPNGELWAAGWAHSTVDDEEFGGTINGWVEARDLSWVARRDCVADECSWEVFTSNDTPELRTSYGTSELAAAVGDLAIAADGTLYASVGHNQLAVYDGSGWETHFVPDPTTGYRATIAPWSNSLAVGTGQLLWAGTNSAPSVTGRGLFTFDGADFTRLTSDDGLPSGHTFQVSVGGDGTVWVATDVLYSDVETASPDQAAGVASFDGTSWTTYTMDDGLLSNDGVVAAGPDGTVWVVHGEIAPRGYRALRRHRLDGVSERSSRRPVPCRGRFGRNPLERRRDGHRPLRRHDQDGLPVTVHYRAVAGIVSLPWIAWPNGSDSCPSGWGR